VEILHLADQGAGERGGLAQRLRGHLLQETGPYKQRSPGSEPVVLSYPSRRAGLTSKPGAGPQRSVEIVSARTPIPARIPR